MNLHKLALPLIRLLEPEVAHKTSLRALRLLPARRAKADDPILSTVLWGREFSNPVGLAAGFDKDAEVTAPMLGYGFGSVEVGSITPRPQPGNPKPRLFRLRADRAVINRMGFNNQGMDAAARRLAARDRTRGPVGVNLGKNKTSTDAAADYAAGARVLGPLADYLVINVSSPNTPGLRALQGRAEVESLIAAVRAVLSAPPPIILKIAPDLTDADKADIAAVAKAGLVDGLIVSNTTIARPDDLASRQRDEAGGLSGRPLMAPSTAVLADMARLTGGTVPLIGVGGIASGADAYAKIRAGASMVQLYSALVYEGPGLVKAIKHDLAARLRADGFQSVADAVGSGL